MRKWILREDPNETEKNQTKRNKHELHSKQTIYILKISQQQICFKQIKEKSEIQFRSQYSHKSSQSGERVVTIIKKKTIETCILRCMSNHLKLNMSNVCALQKEEISPIEKIKEHIYQNRQLVNLNTRISTH